MNITEEDHDLVKNAREILGKHMDCFFSLSLMTASLTPEEDDYPAGPNNMFFKSMLDPRLQRHLRGATHLFWMEHDVTPLRAGWVDALLAETTKRPFWMKGSPYRGDKLDSTATDPKHWNWIGHINGNALYDLRDPAFRDFLRLVIQYEPPSHFWKPFDMSIWRVLHAFPYTWPLHQRHRSKFVYSDFIHHWGFNLTDADRAHSAANPGVFLVHGAAYSAGNWRRAPKPRPAGLVWNDKARRGAARTLRARAVRKPCACAHSSRAKHAFLSRTQTQTCTQFGPAAGAGAAGGREKERERERERETV